jgi:hypothetical protein
MKDYTITLADGTKKTFKARAMGIQHGHTVLFDAKGKMFVSIPGRNIQYVETTPEEEVVVPASVPTGNDAEQDGA